MAPQNDKQLAAAAKLFGLGAKYMAKPTPPNRPRPNRSNGNGNGGGRGTSTVTLHSHNISGLLTVVQTVVPFDKIFKEKSPGVHFYHPDSIAIAVGKLTDYSPLAARSKVRFGLSCEVEVNVTWAGARKVITTKRYTSPWMDLHVALPLSLIIYSKDPPKGEYIVECAGLVDWDAEIQNRSRVAASFKNESKYAEFMLFKTFMEKKSVEDEEEEEETVLDPPSSKPASPNSAEKRRRELD
jgi:hypothetical protein